MNKKSILDKRPLALLFLIEYKNAFFMAFISILFFFFINRESQLQGLTENGYRALVIFFTAIVLWSTNLIPLYITSIMIMGLLATYKVLDSNTVYSFFGNSSVFFIVGAFIISAGVRVSGLSKRVAYYVLGKYGKTPFKLLASVFILSSLLSHIMPEHAVAALMMPILIEITDTVGIDKGSKFGRNLFFAMAWGVIIGGVVTFLGGARNPLAIGMLNEITGEDVDFLSWVTANAPGMYFLMGLVLVYFKMTLRNNKEKEHVKLTEKLMIKKLQKLEKLTFREIKAGFILVATIFLWIFYNKSLGIANIAILSSSLYFMLNVVSWEEVNKEINWGVIFMYGGAIALGKALDNVGVLKWFVDSYLLDLNVNPWVLIGSFSLAALFLTEFMSNAAVIVVLLPIGLNLGMNMGISPKLMTMALAIPSGLAYMLPMSTPATAMISASGFVKLKDMARYGFVMNFLSWAVFMIFAMLYWPLIGIK